MNEQQNKAGLHHQTLCTAGTYTGLDRRSETQRNEAGETAARTIRWSGCSRSTGNRVIERSAKEWNIK